MKDQNCLVHLDDQTGEGISDELRHAVRKFIRQVFPKKLYSLLKH